MTATSSPAAAARPPPRLGIAATAMSPVAIAWAGSALFVLCLLVRTPDLFRHPRFWAEEGSLYYAAMRDLSVVKGLAFVANGNYQFLTNLFVEISILSPPRQAALPTTYLPLIVAAYGCFLMGRLLLSTGCPLLSVAVASALFALQTAGYEVFLSATNVQWVCSVVALLIALQEEVGAASASAFGRYAALMACGLTGTPSCMLLPVVVALAWLQPGRYRWCLAAVLALAVAVQAGVVLAHHGQVHRAFEATPKMAIAFALQTVLDLVLPIDSLNVVALPLRDHAPHWAGVGAQLVLVCVAGLGIVATLALDRMGPVMVASLTATAVGIGLLNALVVLGRVDDLVSGWAGGRYFFLPTTCIVVMLAAGIGARTRALGIIAGLAAAVGLGNAALSAAASSWTGIFASGPSVSAGVDQCRAEGPCRVLVAPDGSGLSVELRIGTGAHPALQPR